MKGILDTSSDTYRKLMGNGFKYEVPKFQRDYTWENEQWDDLWQDIESLIKEEDSEHYMGYLVLQEIDNKNYFIIDGQQRITTLNLMILAVLKCLQDLINKEEEAEDNQKRKDTLFNTYIGFIDPITLISNNKLKLNRNSDDYYKTEIVLLKDRMSIRNTNSSQKHMRECFSWYYEKISKKYKSGIDLAKFIDKIADKLSFTVIRVSDELNAFKVFETLNARGVQLSSSDLLKNYLFSVVDSEGYNKTNIDELELLWSKLIEKLGTQKVEEFIRYYWNSKNKTVRKSNLFKSIRKQITSKMLAFQLVRELNDEADVYMALQNPEDDLWKMNREIQNLIRILKLFKVKQPQSLFLSAYRNLDENNFLRLLQMTVVISFRYNIICGFNPNEQEEVYNDISLYLNEHRRLNTEKLKQIYIPDDNFELIFSSKEFRRNSQSHKLVKYILSEIDKYKNHTDISFESDLFTIEHILPENPETDWQQFDDEAVSRSVYKLGNLTLLEKSLNKDADNISYEKKKELFKESSCKITNSIPEFYESWTESSIASRQKRLTTEAKSIWKIQFNN